MKIVLRWFCSEFGGEAARGPWIPPLAFVLHWILCPISSKCPGASEKSRRTYFWCLGMLKNFSMRTNNIAASLYALSLMKGFIGTRYFQTAGELCQGFV